jgi:hypothetical protein
MIQDGFIFAHSKKLRYITLPHPIVAQQKEISWNENDYRHVNMIFELFSSTYQPFSKD